MNNSGISWTDKTLNPLVGCTNNCSFNGESYCYAREVAKRSKCQKCQSFTPHAHRERLDKYPVKDAGRVVFLGSMAGMWEPGAFSDSDINRVLDFIAAHPGDTFLTLTKNPIRYRDFIIPSNLWVGITITNMLAFWEETQIFIEVTDQVRRFISFEPLLEKIDDIPFCWEDYIDCIIIGPLNHRGKTPTKAEWIMNLMNVAEDAGVMVHLKPQCSPAGVPQDIIDAHQQTPWKGLRQDCADAIKTQNRRPTNVN